MSRVWLIAGVIAALHIGRATAADQPIFAPPANWVLPVETPEPLPPVNAAATRVLLYNEQIHFGPEGLSVYGRYQVRLQTGAGLTAGNISLPWNPDLGSLTIHSVRILRDGQVIDVLAKQKFSVLRRETDLERATLNGVLTAVLEPEDLRVGDIIDVAFTITAKDPALAGHAQSLAIVPNWAIDTLQIRAVSSLPKPFRWRMNDSLTDAQTPATGEGRQVVVRMAKVEPVLPPTDAPMRFQHGRELELSDFRSWSEVSALMAPLYIHAAVIPPSSSLNAEVSRIRSLSSDPKVQAQAALELVQDKVRYVALMMNDGGLVPADADSTWTRRFGDCKGKTVLLIAVLKALGVDVQPALVSVFNGDGLDARLPAVTEFDHVLVRATIAGKVYWLDGARMGDHDLDSLRVPPFHWALPVQPAGATLVALAPAPLERPDGATMIRLDASAGLDLPAKAHLETVLRGDAAVGANASLSNAGTTLEPVLKEYWKKSYSFIEPGSVSASFDAKSNEEHLVMDGVATLDWKVAGDGRGRQYEADGYGLGWKANFKRLPGPHADAPYAVAFPIFEQVSETIVLPNGGKGFGIDGAEVDKQAAGQVFHRTLRIADGLFTMTASTRSLVPEFPASQADDAAKTLTDLADGGVYLRAPANYQKTQQEADAVLASSPTTFRGYMERGGVLLRRGRSKDAAADFTKATALDPSSGKARAALAFAEAWAMNDKAAAIDIAKAASFSPNDPLIYEVEGILAERNGKIEEAVADYGKAVEANPGDSSSRERRVQLEMSLGRLDTALADTTELLKTNPVSARILRSSIMIMEGRLDLALKEYDAAISTNPKSPMAYIGRATILARLGRGAEAQADIARSLAVQPTAEAYLTRASHRATTDYAGKLADIDAALTLKPGSNTALLARAHIEGREGAFDKAVADVDTVTGRAPESVEARLVRAQILVESGRHELAAADFSWVRARAKQSAHLWNQLCWSEATVDASLDLALSDCAAGVVLSPNNAAILDSRAFVLLRLGRTADAISSYDEALEIRPHQAESLYGRGLAELREHDDAHGKADLSAARALDAGVDETFAGYGVRS